MKTNFYQSLNQLVTDSRFRNITMTQNFETYFNSIGVNEAENMHTLSWLLSPNASHGLQDTFFKEMITNAWSLIQEKYDYYKNTKCLAKFAALSPVVFQLQSYNQASVDRQYAKTVPGADMIISDIHSKTMFIINNKYQAANCDNVFNYFTADKYNYFENKVFICFDAQVQAEKTANWIYMNNEWLINLCNNIIESSKYANASVATYVKDYYQFLTGCQYGVAHNTISEQAASLVKDYYEVISSLKSYRAEKVDQVNLWDITPQNYATTYYGQLSQNEFAVLSLCWSYRNTFNTFFQLVEMENVCKDLYVACDQKQYSFESTFVRNGYRLNPTFAKIRTDKNFMNTLFSVDMIQDMNKNMCLNLVINKGAWDKLTSVQRTAFQKDFTFTAVLKDHMVVWNRFYGNNWNSKEICQEITNLFNRIETGFSNMSVKVA